MKIYPKISAGELHEKMKEIIAESEGIEIQFFNQNGITAEFDFETEVRKRKKEFPNLKEIVIHPPLSDYNIELLMLKDEKIVENQWKTIVKLSEDLDISISFVYHTCMSKKQFISTNLDARIKRLLNIVENTNTTILIENLFMMLDERIGCEALEICKYMNHPNLRMCLDTTHMHCKSHIWKMNFDEMLERDLSNEDCSNYVKQVHFAATLNNDGYVDKEHTHGRRHPDKASLQEEVKWLEKYGLKEKIFVTEVSENDYYSRVDQIKEIEMLKELGK